MEGPEPSEAFVAACAAGDVAALRALLDRDPALARARTAYGATALHLAVRHPDALRLLLARGADPNARDTGDNALPLHGAAGGGLVESARVLLDAGSDVQGTGDAHALDTIGWATVFGPTHHDVVDLLVTRGARHHVFSAIVMGDLDLLRRVVREDPGALARRLSRHEQEQTALHYVIAPADGLAGGLFRTGGHYRTLEALIALGADLEAVDAKGRTPLAVAMLRGDLQAMRILHGAGARVPDVPPALPLTPAGAPAASVQGITPMLAVPDVAATVAWYQAIGFTLAGTDTDEPPFGWASVTLGSAEIMFVPSGEPWRTGTTGLSVWLRTDRIDDLYAEFKRRQLERARALLVGDRSDALDAPFVLDLHTAFYGQREFGIRDPNGVELMFAQPLA